MAEYMLSLPEIQDPEMPDGTTGFAMALARNNTKLVEVIFSYYHKNPQSRADERQRDIRIAEEAILELYEESQMKSVLEKSLKDLGHVRKDSAPRRPKCKQ